MQDAAALEVAVFAHPVQRHGQRRVLFAQHRTQLRRRPQEKRALLALAVRVGGGVERALRRGHVAQHVVQRLPGDALIPGVAGEAIRFGVQARQIRLVVEHLLEVRHQPLRIDRVAVKAAADLIVDAAARHGLQRGLRRLQRLLIAGAQRMLQQQEQ